MSSTNLKLPKSVAKTMLPTTFGAFDGREQACLDYVRSKAKRDPASVTKAIDEYAYNNKWMMNVGDVKGKHLDEALQRSQPKLILELGTYVGYSALRMIQQAPGNARIISIEYSDMVAQIARQIIEHAGMSDRIKVVHGYLQDKEGKTKHILQTEYNFRPGCLDFVFLDHVKEAYLHDLKLILNEGWFHPGSVAFADNVLYPGAPDYKKFMEDQDGKLFHTKFIPTFLEYQSKMPDLVLESVFLGESASAL